MKRVSRHGRPSAPTRTAAALAFGTAVWTLMSTTPAAAQADKPQADKPALRVCAAESDAPFSTKDEQGFENRIARIVADAMGREVRFVWADKPAIYLVRDWLDKGLCDVVMGLDTGDTRVLTTRPYYRTAYVSVSRADRNLAIASWNDQRIEDLNRFAVRFHSPAEFMLKVIGKYEDNLAYVYSLVNFKSSRNQYVQIPGNRLVSEVVTGEADLAVAFAPEIARYVHESSKPLVMTVLADDAKMPDGEPVPQHFDQSMAVRLGDTALLGDLNAAIDKARAKIEAELVKEGIPLLSRNS